MTNYPPPAEIRQALDSMQVPEVAEGEQFPVGLSYKWLEANVDARLSLYYMDARREHRFVLRLDAEGRVSTAAAIERELNF